MYGLTSPSIHVVLLEDIDWIIYLAHGAGLVLSKRYGRASSWQANAARYFLM